MINYISKTGNFYIPYSLSYNKMIEILTGSKKLVEDHFFNIISGKYPLLVNISENNKSYLIVGKQDQFLIGMVHFLAAFFRAKNTIFKIDLSSGKTPLLLMIFLI